MVRIMSRAAAHAALLYDPYIPVVAIGETFGNEVEQITSIAKDFICVKFDDIEIARPGYTTVNESQIKKILKWAENKDDFIVACRAGISRSSAIAYLIVAEKTSPEEAIKILDMAWHQPNPLVVEVGAKVIGNQKIQEVYNQWKKELYERYL